MVNSTHGSNASVPILKTLTSKAQISWNAHRRFKNYIHTTLTVFMHLTWPRVLWLCTITTQRYTEYLFEHCVEFILMLLCRQYHKKTSSQELNKIDTATLQHTNYLQSTKKNSTKSQTREDLKYKQHQKLTFKQPSWYLNFLVHNKKCIVWKKKITVWNKQHFAENKTEINNIS